MTIEQDTDTTKSTTSSLTNESDHFQRRILSGSIYQEMFDICTPFYQPQSQAVILPMVLGNGALPLRFEDSVNLNQQQRQPIRLPSSPRV
jgi:hypothetical protein